MPVGAYSVSIGETGQVSYYGGAYTVCEYGSFSQTVRFRSITFYGGGTSGTVKGVIYNTSGTKIAETSAVAFPGQNVAAEVIFSSPPTLTANTNYYIGLYSENGGFAVQSGSASHSHTSTYANWVEATTSHYYSSGDTYPGSGTANAWEIQGSLSFDAPNLVPNAPSLQTPADNVTLNPLVSQTFTWTHSDPEGNPQTAYAIRFREVGTSTWAGPYGASTATASHTFAANTFTEDKVYEWQVSTSDAAGQGPYSTSRTFTATPYNWTTSAAVATSTQSHTFPTGTFAAGKRYVYQVRTADAAGFGPWSANQTIGSLGGLFYVDGVAYQAQVDGVDYLAYVEKNGVWTITT